jgi:hypothetical protein
MPPDGGTCQLVHVVDPVPVFASVQLGQEPTDNPLERIVSGHCRQRIAELVHGGDKTISPEERRAVLSRAGAFVRDQSALRRSVLDVGCETNGAGKDASRSSVFQECGELTGRALHVSKMVSISSVRRVEEGFTPDRLERVAKYDGDFRQSSVESFRRNALL